MLGPLAVDDRELPRGQQTRLLGALLLERGRVVPVEALARWCLGPERRYEVGQIQVLVARLRRQLRELNLPGTVRTLPGGYRLDAEPAAVDAQVFEERVAESDALDAPQPRRARALLAEALRMWRGDALAGLGLDGHPEVVRLDELRLLAVEAAFRLDLRTAAATEVVPELLAACRSHPRRERLRVLGMVALYLAGRQADALELFQEGRRHLVEELGIEPGPHLVAAEAAVLHHDAGALRNQLDRPGGRLAPRRSTTHGAAAPSPSALPPEPTGLPRFITSFVGRQRALDALCPLLATARLVTLTGPGGVGKTRLAAAAAAVAASEGRAVWFCELASLGRGAAVDLVVAQAVGARVERGRTATEAVVAAVGRRRGLLAIDCCDLVVAGAAALVRALVGGCPHLTILATGREPLAVLGEVVWRVPPLDPATEAVELFGERARQAAPGFAPGDEELAKVRQLCVRLDGLPLAVELAAARVRSLSPADLLAHLDDRFELLRIDAASREERHRSLEATIDWSHRLLDDAQQRLLRRMAVFAGRVDLDAVVSVCVDDELSRRDVLRALPELVDRSMVWASRTTGGLGYQLLDTIRAFALERLVDSGQRPKVERRHADYYARRRQHVLQRVQGPDEVAAVAELDDIWPELRSAVRWAVGTGDAAVAVPLVLDLGFEAVFRERSEVVTWTDEVLSLPGVLDHPDADRLLGTAALADWGYGRFDPGLARAEEAVRVHHQRCTPLSSDVAAALPLHVSLRGDLPRTLALLRAHGQEAAAAQATFTQAHMAICEAMALGYGGPPPDAEPVLRAAEALADQTGAALLGAIALFTRAIVLLDSDPAAAVDHARRSLELAASVRATWFLSAGANYVVAAMARTDQVHRCRPELEASLERVLDGATNQSVANAIRNAVVVLDRLGRAPRTPPLIGWLQGNRPSIPGSPGMRDHASALAVRLRREMGDDVYESAAAAGTWLTPGGAAAPALRELRELREVDTADEAGAARRTRPSGGRGATA